jgi:hypothetical protein
MKMLVAVCLFFGVLLGGMVTTAEAGFCGCGNCWMQVYKICSCGPPYRYCRSDEAVLKGTYAPTSQSCGGRARLIVNDTPKPAVSYQPGDCEDPLGCIYVFQITKIDPATGLVEGMLPNTAPYDGLTYTFRVREVKPLQVGKVYAFSGFGKSVYLDLHLPVGP